MSENGPGDIFEAVIKHGGKLDPGAAPSPAVIRGMRNQLPSGLVDFVVAHGFCSLDDGWIWLCNPDDFAQVAAEILRGQPGLAVGGFVPYCHDAFGRLFLWSATLRTRLEADILSGIVIMRISGRPTSPAGPIWTDDYVVGEVLLAGPEGAPSGPDARNLLPVAKQSAGRLQAGMIYGWPPETDGDPSARPDLLRRVVAAPHLAALAARTRFTFVAETSLVSNFSVTGFPQEWTPATQEAIQQYAGQFPADVIAFWRAFGFCSLHRGYLRLTNPEQFAFLADDLFGNDPDFAPLSLMAFCYTALGSVVFWSAIEHVMVDVDLLDGTVVTYDAASYKTLTIGPDGLPHDDPDSRRKTGSEILSGVVGAETPDDGMKDADTGELMYDVAARRLGKPGPGEMFAFVPALALGGERRAANLRRVAAREHMSILA